MAQPPTNHPCSDVKIMERLYLRGDLLGQGGQASCYEVVTRCRVEDDCGARSGETTPRKNG